MDMRAVLATKRDGAELEDDAIRAFVDGYASGEVQDYEASALLMAIFIHGMVPRELGTLTRAMLHSGEVFDFRDLDGPKVDKHSTGGIGDKVSIPLAPAVAVCGAYVPMISGRGLGHTGGTLDKLEAIPGFRTDLDAATFRRALVETGLALGGQTENLVPADRKLYALRDVTGLIESIPLITSSILSKKLAEGIDALVLDIKFGSGAFMVERERGAELGRTMVAIAEDCGVRATAFQTNMERPLGRAMGNAIEINESLACLEGGGPADLRELVCLQGGEMLRLCGLVDDLDAGKVRIAASLDDGSARERFARLTELQGGDPRALDRGLEIAGSREVLAAEAAGYLHWKDLRAVGYAVGHLGGGRLALGDAIDPGVGLELLQEPGTLLQPGDPILEIQHADGHGLERAKELLAGSYELLETSAESPLVLE
jgi:pyrimidine-nucleoside phosphorylase